MEKHTFEMISIDTKHDRCFFHVLGDSTEYYDLLSLENNHSELTEHIKKNRIALERALLRQKEIMSAPDKY